MSGHMGRSMSVHRYSIRRRLIVRTMACMLLILGGISLAAHWFARYESEEFFSARLASSARVLETLVAHQLETATIGAPIVVPIPQRLGYSGGATPYGHPYEHKIAFQVWQVFALKSGHVWVVVAEKDEVREEMVEQLGASVLAPVIIGGILLVLAVNLVLATNLAPLRTLADAIARREPESLAPVELPDLPRELAPVVDELNSLLQRVAAAFEREQQFIDAAAHEIRTPIAAVQLHVQNALRAANQAECDTSLGEAVGALERTTQLAEQLLTFSRLASGTDMQLQRQVSLAEVCRDVMALQEPLLDRRGQSLGLSATHDCSVQGDPYRLQQLLRNLIENASRHGLARGDIDVAIDCTDGQCLLRVSNDGEPVPEEETDNVFRPYYRLRPGGKSGAGLGLSIVRQIADQHGATVTIAHKADAQGCVVTVAFPR
jgi:two-component system sensor histidine kinase QseC